jgi:hypothetical protein
VFTAGGGLAADSAAISAAIFPLLATDPDAADAKERTTMPITTALPWGAVGFLDNGCTASLIDNQHILAASHCFTFDGDGPILPTTGLPQYLQGAWQSGFGGLVFFPNYHPSRTNPPRFAVDRAVVGSRVQTGSTAQADWGIGHLATPVTDFPALTIDPIPRWRYPDFVAFAGYARDIAIYPKGNASFPQPAPGGYCPNFGNNCWWIPALVDPKCLALHVVGTYVATDVFSCPIQGGNSGSPVVWNRGSGEQPAFRLTGVISDGGRFWNARWFQHAPRFAADVAVASHDDGTQQTQVFAADRDLGHVVSRLRTDTSTSGAFTPFRDLGALPQPGPLAAFRLQNGRPQVVVVSGNGKLLTSYVVASGQWQAWQTLAGPSDVGGFLDIAAAIDAGGIPHLYVIGSDDKLYTTRATGAAGGVAWGNWSEIPTGVGAERVSVVRHGDGRQQVFVVSTAGAVHSVWQTNPTSGSAWSSGSMFFGSTQPIADVSAGLTPLGQVQVFAVDDAGAAWSRRADQLSPTGTWGSWTPWRVPLYAPVASKPPALDGLVSLTASRWLEGGGTVPVVFGTDRQGNIYVTTFENNQWQPWRSFYN